MGCLQPGRSGTCQWTDGNEFSSISLRCDSHLSYTLRAGDGEREEVTEIISIVRVPCRLEPIWRTKANTAHRVRSRIETVLDWAKARGYRQGDNPLAGAVI